MEKDLTQRAAEIRKNVEFKSTHENSEISISTYIYNRFKENVGKPCKFFDGVVPLDYTEYVIKRVKQELKGENIRHDIVVWLEEKVTKKTIKVIIENKFKCNATKEQLDKYTDRQIDQRYVLLSLMPPTFNTGIWTYKSYEDVCDYLKGFGKKCDSFRRYLEHIIELLKEEQVDLKVKRYRVTTETLNALDKINLWYTVQFYRYKVIEEKLKKEVKLKGHVEFEVKLNLKKQTPRINEPTSKLYSNNIFLASYIKLDDNLYLVFQLEGDSYKQILLHPKSNKKIVKKLEDEKLFFNFDDDSDQIYKSAYHKDFFRVSKTSLYEVQGSYKFRIVKKSTYVDDLVKLIAKDIKKAYKNRVKIKKVLKEFDFEN